MDGAEAAEAKAQVVPADSQVARRPARPAGLKVVAAQLPSKVLLVAMRNGTARQAAQKGIAPR